ncbi:hypothetical protein SteCoe_24890 [Stentor coeruleus]|uniref:F-box domain-containing protein n=1 Tax=Stentor coeruleus TaxID=5963 RepID=A0A1R2BGJ4_9CILI|nr:hypothetical protein SteCoe_24890 [Stentor coeruleus]
MNLNTKKISLQTIRQELLLNILSYLDNQTYFLIFPTLNKYFKAATYNLLKYKTFIKLIIGQNSFEPIMKILENLKISYSLKSLELLFILDIPYTNDKFMQIKELFELSVFPSRLSTLSISIKNFILPEDFFYNFSNLNTIKIHSESFFFNIEKPLFNLLRKNQSVSNLSVSAYEFKQFEDVDSLAEFVSTYENLSIFCLKVRNSKRVAEYRLKKSFFTSNSCLLELKIGENFVFDINECQDFCKVIANNKTLRFLSISESITRMHDDFLAALDSNKTLTTLKLKHLFVDQYVRRVFKISPEDTIEILEKIGNSCITSFSITTFYSKGAWFFYNEFFHDEDYHNSQSTVEEDYIRTLDELLSKRKFSNISVNFVRMNEDHKELCLDMLIKHAFRGDYTSFNGYILERKISDSIPKICLRKKIKMSSKFCPPTKTDFSDSFCMALSKHPDQEIIVNYNQLS